MIWSRLCPQCGSRSWRRSKRRGLLEWIVSAIVLPVRCEHCDLRVYRLRGLLSRTTPPAVGADED